MHRKMLVVLLGLAAVACVTVGEEDKKPAMNGEYVAAPTFLKKEIEERVAALPYQTEQQLYDNLIRLAYIGEPAIPYLLDGLDDENARTRSSCAYVLGLMRDRRTIAPLTEHLEDPVPEVRYEIATSLCSLGVREGYPVLIEGLSDSDIRNRYKCHEALKMLTRLDYGYEHDAEPSARAAAIRRWQQWWERLRQEP